MKAVDDISLIMYEGETLGLVGESGCGKSTLGRTILKLYDATSGDIYFEGQNITKYKFKQMRSIRKNMQIGDWLLCDVGLSAVLSQKNHVSPGNAVFVEAVYPDPGGLAGGQGGDGCLRVAKDHPAVV